MSLSELSGPVFLCGMMGSGKSTIGRLLARKTGLPFRDLDQLLEAAEGRSIPDIFKNSGEDYFRKTEALLLTKHSDMENGILALGGGSLQNQKLVDHVKKRGCLVYLETSAGELCKRLKKSTHRPMLAGDLEKRVETLLKQRRPFYEQAHIIVKTGGRSKNEIVNELINHLKTYEIRN